MGHASLVSVELKELIGALANLPLWIEHEAASKGVDLAVICNRAVALAALYRLCADVRDSLPDDCVSIDLCADNFTASIVVEATNEVHGVADGCESGAFTWSWLPHVIERDSDLKAEALSFLHPLDVMLQTAHKLVN